MCIVHFSRFIVLIRSARNSLNVFRIWEIVCCANNNVKFESAYLPRPTESLKCDSDEQLFVKKIDGNSLAMRAMYHFVVSPHPIFRLSNLLVIQARPRVIACACIASVVQHDELITFYSSIRLLFIHSLYFRENDQQKCLANYSTFSISGSNRLPCTNIFLGGSLCFSFYLKLSDVLCSKHEKNKENKLNSRKKEHVDRFTADAKPQKFGLKVFVEKCVWLQFIWITRRCLIPRPIYFLRVCVCVCA